MFQSHKSTWSAIVVLCCLLMEKCRCSASENQTEQIVHSHALDIPLGTVSCLRMPSTFLLEQCHAFACPRHSSWNSVMPSHALDIPLGTVSCLRMPSTFLLEQCHAFSCPRHSSWNSVMPSHALDIPLGTVSYLPRSSSFLL